MSTLRARWPLAAVLLVGLVLAGCTNPDYATEGSGGVDACAGRDTTAPVTGDGACPVDPSTSAPGEATNESDTQRTLGQGS